MLQIIFSLLGLMTMGVCCEWERVTCNITTGHVTHLSLHNIRDFIEYDYYEKHNAWFLNVSLFETFKELKKS